MIIELTGLPGAGKTTFESCIISGLKQRGIRVSLREDLQDRYKQGIISPNYEEHAGLRILSNRLYRLSKWKGLINAGLGGGIFREILTRRRRITFSWLGEDINLSTYFLHEFKHSRAGQSAYFPHEGFVHHSASFKVWGGFGFPDLHYRLLQKIPSHNFAIIYFKVSVDVALERIIKRGLPEHWPRSINSKAKVKEVLFRFDRAIEDVVEKFQTSEVKVFPVDASLKHRQVESRIKSILDNFPENVDGKKLENPPKEN